MRQRLNQRGPMPTVGSNFGNFGQDKKRSFYVSKISGVRKMKMQKIGFWLYLKVKNQKFDDLATYFEQNHLKNLWATT